MIQHPKIHCLLVEGKGNKPPDPWPLIDEEMDTIQLSYAAVLPEACAEYDTIITCGEPLPSAAQERLLGYVQKGGGWLAMTMLDEHRLPEAFGVQPSSVGPSAELRVLFQDYTDPIAERLPDALYVAGRFHPLEVHASDVRTLLYTDWHYSHQAVFTTRNWGEGHLACSTLQDFTAPMLRQVVHRLLRQWHGSAPTPKASWGVGILGYAPSVGLAHGLSMKRMEGLHLQAVCDLNPERLTQAGVDFPGVRSYASAASLAQDEDINLVIVATAPNVHAQLSMEMMAAGKHVLCEKPLALNSQEAEAMLQTANKHGVHLSCHQNRRWDPDFRAILDIVKGGRIGELFHVETFVGGFHHPCGYWHSHRPISGGTTFDWGAHYIDWLVALLPEPVSAICGSRHKRV
ncbi:MAG: Gfo/Idh/MocA family oxidoreductase, partial [bacterium]|nr:Gfo/Idh/MocA family oxidoreductase [bacterium]